MKVFVVKYYDECPNEDCYSLGCSLYTIENIYLDEKKAIEKAKEMKGECVAYTVVE